MGGKLVQTNTEDRSRIKYTSIHVFLTHLQGKMRCDQAAMRKTISRQFDMALLGRVPRTAVAHTHKRPIRTVLHSGGFFFSLHGKRFTTVKDVSGMFSKDSETQTAQ